MKRIGVYVDEKFNTCLALALICILTAISVACPFNSVINQLQTDIPLLNTEAVAIIQLVSPGDVALAQRVSSSVLPILKTVKDAADAYQAANTASNLQKLVSALDAAGQDIPAVLNGLQFGDANTLPILEAALAGIVIVLDAVASQLPQTRSVGSAARQTRMASRNVPKAKQKVPSPSEVKAYWTSSVCPKARACPAL